MRKKKMSPQDSPNITGRIDAPEGFADNALDIRQTFPIGEVGEAITPYNRVQFGLSTGLDYWVNHQSDKSGHECG
jgi:hypothetical protein